MKKLLIALFVGLFAVSTPAAQAAGIALSDAEMDEIAAGDWVVINEGQEVVDGIHYSNNDIKLNDESQMELQALSNANVVDSAVAVQTNTASVSEGNEPTNNVEVKGYNEATIANYNPSEEKNMSYSSSKSKAYNSAYNSTKAATKNASQNAAYSSSSAYSSTYTKDETLDINETLDAAAAFAAVSEDESKYGETETAVAAAAVLDYDYVLDYDLDIDKNKTKTSAASKTYSSSYAGTYNSSKNKTKSATYTSTKTKTKSYRKNLSENNHIDLEDTAQKNMVVLSNLNSVGSGAAIQTNVATNVGVNGIISGTNIANVVNGL